ncbi:MAG: hypothetical protein WCK98_04400 [bacterium]
MTTNNLSKKTFEQLFPILFAGIVFIAIAVAYYFWITVLNIFPGEKILLSLNWTDVVVGLTIYLKTAVDFALIIGIFMKNYPGLKNRLAIETGTAIGNALGTAIILVIWYFFKEIIWLLAIMVIFASLVLLKLAQTSIEHIFEDQEKEHISPAVVKSATFLNSILNPINKFLSPVLSKVVPEMKFDAGKKLTFWGLVVASFTIPFILGLDDFAGYVPLFNVVNVFGFGLGVFLGHCILNIFLFINPNKTIEIVKNPIIGVLGSLVFIGLSIWGLYEATHLLNEVYFHLHF